MGESGDVFRRVNRLSAELRDICRRLLNDMVPRLPCSRWSKISLKRRERIKFFLRSTCGPARCIVRPDGDDLVERGVLPSPR